ncbi:MAG: hypothetical protein WCO52_00875 [bacterium]
MVLKHHKNLDIEKWQNASLSFQMANIGSEISRTIIWRNKNNTDYSDRAFERALELIDLTAASQKNKGRLREVMRMRESLVGWKLAGQYEKKADEAWQHYFDAFAIVVRKSAT